jgi:hypothetical protein
MEPSPEAGGYSGRRPLTAVEFLLVANYVVVAMAVVVSFPVFGLMLISSLMAVPRVDPMKFLVASVLIGAAVTGLTFRCLRSFDARLAVAIAVFSAPVYLVLAMFFAAL